MKRDGCPRPAGPRRPVATSYYQPGEHRAAQVERLFGTIARRYDLINDLQSLGLHRRWKRRLAAYTSLHANQLALDVCCGTGDVLFQLARQGVTTVGLDFSEPMLAVARARRDAAPGPSSPQLLRGDAQRLPFPDQSFDGVTVAYGLRNLADWRIGLREMVRVCKRGGTIACLDFGKPRHRFWAGVYVGYLRLLVPQFGRWFCSDPAAYAYILDSLREFPAQAGIAAEMSHLGCSGVRVVNILGGAMAINLAQKA